MNTRVMKAPEISFDLELLFEEVGKLLVNVLNDGVAAVLLVNLIPITSSAHDCQAEVYIALLQLCRGSKMIKKSNFDRSVT